MAKHGWMTLDTIEDLGNKMGGEEKIKKFLSGELVLVERETLVPVPPPMPEPFQFKVWKTIKLGLHQTPAAYRQALKAGNFKIGTYADQILDKITIAETVIEVNLARVTPRELGFKRNVRYEDFCERVVEQGAELCPDEVGPASRLQLPDLPYGEWFRVAMKALSGSGGGLRVFGVGRDGGGRWLFGSVGDPDALYGPDRRFVVVVPRK